VYPDLATDVTALFERADYALYHGKRTNRGHATLFSHDHDAQIHRDTRIEQALHTADLHAELMIFFQPIVNITSNKTIGFEALARWLSPQLGPVAPGLFIPLAERIGKINAITSILFGKALRVATDWPEDMRLSFNLSAQDISSPEGIAELTDILRKSGFNPARLDLEITETAVMHDFGQARIAIESLKKLGCGISLDDFGTGFSSLSQLHALPLTKIKVDRSFVVDLHMKPASYKIVKSLVALSRDMGLGCIVEGVETEEEMQALRTMGSISVQGYYYSPPIPEGQIAEFLQTIPAIEFAEIA
jgi:predicted signal transduction protein with EAL and GGDEF domain